MSAEALVHVIDDDEAVRASLDFLFASAGVPARVYDNPLAFLEHAGAQTLGCVVTDIRMPEMNGIELLRRLREKGAQLPVIVITGHGDVPLAVEAMKSGACDFLEKPFSDEALLSAVGTAMTEGVADGDLRSRLAQLSTRERQVLEHLVAGQANKVIGRELGISDRTVEIYRAKVMSKMGAGSFADLVRMAIQAGLAPPDPTAS